MIEFLSVRIYGLLVMCVCVCVCVRDRAGRILSIVMYSSVSEYFDSVFISFFFSNQRRSSGLHRESDARGKVADGT